MRDQIEAPVRVAIVGGGCAALAAAFELTRPERDGQYQVTVFQQGWRLGGKGASGRGPADRIEEHGLHVWLGYYENAFGLIREVYKELGRDPATCPISDWTDAFFPSSAIGVMEQSGEGDWRPWVASFPETDDVPGDGVLAGDWPPDGSDYLRRTVALLQTLVESAGYLSDRADRERSDPNDVRDTIDALAAGRPLAGLVTLVALREAISVLGGLSSAVGVVEIRPLRRVLDGVRDAVQDRIASTADTNPEIRRVWEMIDIVLANLRGAIRFRLFTRPEGFDAIDHFEYRDWLRLCGVSEEALDSAVLRGLYNLAFAHEDGDTGRARISAGQALRCGVRTFFTYRGSLFWKMSAGMGDVVFAPLYEVLKRRGVDFRFFHRLGHVAVAQLDALDSPAGLAGRLPDEERPFVSSLEFDIQAEPIGGEYRPLTEVGGLPCWPARPDFSQLADGARLEHEQREFESYWERRTWGRKELRVGADFDQVIIGVGIGALEEVCGELIAADRRWRQMIEKVKTVATQAFQLWLSEDVRSLGASDDGLSIAGFVEPFDTWSDMSHLVPREDWGGRTKSIAYFCSTLPDAPAEPGADDDVAARSREEVRRNAVRFMNDDLGWLWPHSTHGSGFDWELLVHPDAELDPALSGEERFGSQFWVANVNPTDRYTLALPGSSRFRISPLDPTYDNLTLAGDWTDCSYNVGCVEAAVMSGRLAAHAISMSPPLSEIVGFDHP